MELKRVPYPRLLKDNGDFDRTIIPVSASINLCITPLSYASLDLPMHETIEERSYIELFTPFGSAGVFRVRSPSDTYGEGMITTAELEHAIVEVGDYVVRTKYDEMMAAGTAMQTIFSHYRGSRWQLGSVAAMGTGQIAVQADHVRVLEAMLALLDQCPSCMLSFDFSTTPWTVSVVSRGTVVAAEGRLSRNVNGARIIYDDTELCTRAYYEISSTGSGGEPSSTWTSMDADTINVYGVVERDVPAGTDLTPAEAQRVVTEYLRKHKHPRISVEINAEELSNITGEPWDTFTVGKLFRLSLPDYNKTVEQTVTAVAWGDVYSNPYDMTVSLAEEEDTAITFLHDLDAKGGSGGGGAAQKQTEKIIRENKTERESDRYSWEMVKQKTDRNGNILQQAGIELDPNGIIMYAEDNERQIAGKLKLTAESLTSDYTDKINNTESHITQTAGQIRAEVSDHVAGLNSSITQTAGQIRAELNDEVNNLTSSITQTAESLTSDYTDKINGVSSHITQTASEIRSEVEDEVSGLSSSIQQNADSIALNAKNIKIIADDYVTINRLDTELAEIKDQYSGFISTGTIEADTGNIMSVNAVDINGIAANTINISVDGQTVATVIGEGSDVNFDRAKAAQEGANSVTLTSKGWVSGGRNVVEASNGKSYTVNLPSFSTSGGTSFSSHKTTVYFSTASVDGPLKTVEVDASSEYNAGSTAGANGVTLSKGNWSSGVTRVTASNGKTVDVSLPSFSVSGGDSFGSDHKTTVYFSTPSVEGALKSKTVDASGQYSSGVTAGANGVTLSVGSWSGGKVTVTASNKKTATVSLPSFSVSGGDSFNSDHQTTVYFSTPSVDGALKSKTVDATSVWNGGRGQGMTEYYSSGHWAKPSSSNSWTCYVPSQYNSSAETWFKLSDILPTPSYTWTNPAKGYARAEFYICGKHYHTSKQIPGGWM